LFTGIIQGVGRIREVNPRGGDAEFVFDTGDLSLADCGVGDSIAVGGACLTVTRLEPRAFAADLSRETLGLTTLGRLTPGSRVNLEKALRAGQALGGHYVTGHVDGVAEVTDVRADARSSRMYCQVPAALARYIAAKGSVTLDGVSLTVNEVDGRVFGVNLIPHTLAVTTLGELRAGQQVNLEVDIIARYAERLLRSVP
jgi:riboflavin synthase